MATKYAGVLTSGKRLRAQTPKSSPTSYFSFSFLSVFQKWTGKSFYANVSSFVTQKVCVQDWPYFYGHTGKYFLSVLFIEKFRVCKYDMQDALEINSKDRIKQVCEIFLYVESTTMFTPTKLGKMVRYLEWIVPIKSHDCIV